MSVDLEDSIIAEFRRCQGTPIDEREEDGILFQLSISAKEIAIGSLRSIIDKIDFSYG